MDMMVSAPNLSCPSQSEDPLQPAVDWLKGIRPSIDATEVQQRLLLGFNRALRLLQVSVPAAEPSPDEVDPLQEAVRWLNRALATCATADVQSRLLIPRERAEDLARRTGIDSAQPAGDGFAPGVNSVSIEDHAALGESLEHARQWYGVRLKRLWQWAHDELPEPLRTRYFSIVANGRADVHEPPSYDLQLNVLRHRAEAAEAEVQRLTQHLARIAAPSLVDGNTPSTGPSDLSGGRP